MMRFWERYVENMYLTMPKPHNFAHFLSDMKGSVLCAVVYTVV